MDGSTRAYTPHRLFHAGEREAHHRFGVADEAERMSDVVTTRLSVGVRQFVEAQPFFFIGTNGDGRAPVACDIVLRMNGERGEALPLVKVLDTKTLRFALPGQAAQKGGRVDAALCDGCGIGLLFVDFLRGIRYRINGRAIVRRDLSTAAAAPWPAAGCSIVELTVAQAYGNCATRVVRLQPGNGP